MNRLRHGSELRISFFAFQDIITSVTGILILVTLMLSFSLRSSEESAPVEERMETSLQADRARLAALEAQNAAMQARRLEATTLPSRRQLEIQLESLRRDETEVLQKRRQSEATLASAAERLEKLQTQQRVAAELSAESETLQARLAALQDQLKSARTNAAVALVLPEAEARRSEKKPYALVVNGDRIIGQRLDGSQPRETALTSPASLSALLDRLDPDKDLLVFFFRPSGAKWFEGLRAVGRAAGFEVGYDAVEEQKTIQFSTP